MKNKAIRLLPAMFCLTWLTICPVHLQAQTWAQAAAALQQDAGRIEQNARDTLKGIQEERERLTQEAAELEKSVAESEQALTALKERFGTMGTNENKLREELAAVQKEYGNIGAAMRVASKDAESLMRSNMKTPENPARLEVLKPFKNTDRFPDFTALQALVDALFEEMVVDGKVETTQGPVINRSGREVETRIGRIGSFCAYYREGDQIGFLRPSPNGERLVAQPANLSRGDRNRITDFLQGKGTDLPLDISDGAALEQMRSGKSLKEWLAAGGFLIWPIVAVAVAALFLIMERLFFLSRTKGNTDRILGEIQALAAAGKWDACLDICRDNPNAPACRVLLAGLERRSQPREIVEHAVEEAMLKETPKLERFLPTLSVLAAIAPLLGLLGTVTGMIETFQVITFFGTGDPRLMAGGISEALITTQLGLAVAMPIIVIHHFLERRVDHILVDMEEKGLALWNGGL